MIDIVHFAMAVTQLDQSRNRGDNIFDAQDITAFVGSTGKRLVQQAAVPRVLLGFGQFLFVCARIKFHTAYAGQIVAVFTEEQAVKQLLDRLFGGRFARTHHTVNRNTRRLPAGSLIRAQGIGNISTLIQLIDVKGRNFFYAVNIKFGQQLFCNFIIGRSQYLAGFRINQIGSQCFAQQAFLFYIQTGQACIGNITDIFRSNALTFGNQYIAFFIQDIDLGSFAFQTACDQIGLNTV
ncbi:Uncharacterised protein [Neisseria gonorrhoeae]|nr:Uncharacterised protein [Neisseria gonorrhoeae]CNQ04800.1 Uncharacterised protein [Neisseria gonorrhoeae]CNR60126.1 Uncharacterised protein [Neisseria gonorrhoeae]CNS53286.1 Uncharacterised protein [Neisseria gonorrhoeae]